MIIKALTLIVAVLAATPFTAGSQQFGRVPRVGVLANEPWSPIDGLRDGLAQSGYVDGKTVTIDYRWSRGRPEQLAAMVEELLKAKTDVIVTVGTPPVLAAKRATSTVPIVMGLIGDPVGAGVVSNIARPESNVTGVSVLAAELEPKRLEVLKELIPGLSRVAILGNAGNPYSAIAIKHAERGAENLGLKLTVTLVRSAADLDDGLADLVRQRPQAVLIPADQMLLSHRARIADYLNRNHLPSAYTYREHVEAGGLLSYSTNYYESFRRSAGYVAKILKGAKPGDLPIEQVDRFDLVLNLKTAKALGLTIQQPFLVRADQVMQ
jgi:putative ABC transport system substrate-binding protein